MKSSLRDLVIAMLLTIVVMGTLHNLFHVTSSDNTRETSTAHNLNNLRKNADPKLSTMISVDSRLTISPTLTPTLIPSVALTLTPKIDKTPRLVSLGKPVRADVRGNLGPPEVVTNEKTVDWLKDRWQAAVDMSGRPIPGEHWLEIDLQSVFSLTTVLIDWEDGFSNQWTVQGRQTPEEKWFPVFQSTSASGKSELKQSVSKKHVLHSFTLSSSSEVVQCRYVRLLIHKPATQWGVSVWRMQVWGYES